MINANELRIGNWVVSSFDDLNKRSTKRISEVEPKNDFDPIPLIPEVLKEAGSENPSFSKSVWALNRIALWRDLEETVNDCAYSVEYTPTGETDRRALNVKVYHFHQLQNWSMP